MSLSSIQLEKPTVSGWVQPDKKIIVLDKNTIRTKQMSRILWLTGQVELKSYLHEIPEQWDLLIINYDELSDTEKDLLHQKLTDPFSLKKILILSANQSPFQYIKKPELHYWKNFLNIKNETLIDELLVTVQKMLFSGSIFGIEKYFAWGAGSFSISIKSSLDRENIWNIAADFAVKTGIPSRMQNMFCTVTDELVTNALYNAPTDNSGKSKFSFLPRTTEVSLEIPIFINFLCDGKRLGISVSDPFGSLSPNTVISYLAHCAQKDSSQIVKKSGGAGLGLYLVFDSLSHLVININKGIQTEIIGLLDIRGTYKDFVTQGKSLNIFEV
jgi:hypothetical protein